MARTEHQQELEALAKPRRRLVMNRVATRVSVGEELLTILDEPKAIGETVEELISSIATIVDLTSANQSPTLDPTRNPNKGDRVPHFGPAWAANKLEQLNRQLYEIAGGVNAWCNSPHDPTRPDCCDKCGRNRGRDDLYCRQCGTPTLHAYRRCWVRACTNLGKQRMKCPDRVWDEGAQRFVRHPGTVPDEAAAHPSSGKELT